MVKLYFSFFFGKMVKLFFKQIVVKSKVCRLREIFSSSKSLIYFIVSNSLKKIVTVWFCIAHSVRRNFLNIMPLLARVQASCWPSESGCGSVDQSKFVRCVDGRDPEVHEFWIWGDDGIIPKLHLTAWVDIKYWVTCDFATNNFTENGSSTVILSKNSLMEVLGFWALLIHWGPAGLTGLKISCVPVCVRGL